MNSTVRLNFNKNFVEKQYIRPTKTPEAFIAIQVLTKYSQNNKIKTMLKKRSINYMSSSPSFFPFQKGASRFVLWRCWVWWLHELGCKSFGLWFSFRIFIVENPEKKPLLESFSASSPYSTPTQVGTENFSK